MRRMRFTLALLFAFTAAKQIRALQADFRLSPTLDSASLVTSAASVTSFSPTQGALGTIVTITGSGFTGTTSVKFGGVPATFTVVSDTSIKATVPTLAVTGTIAIGSVVSASTFKVLPGILLSPAVGPPTSVTTVSGSGFAANELVDIYETTTDVALAVTSTGGTFTGISLTVLSYTPPGPLWISAAGRHSQLAAQRSFNVTTSWTQPRRTAAGSAWNPYENVLNSSSVTQLELAWTTTNGTYLSNVPGGVIVSSGIAIAPLAHLGTLTAVRTTGSQLWSQPLSSSFFSGPTPAASGNFVVAAATDGKLHAFNFATGAVAWTTAGPNDTGAGSPVILSSTVYAPGATALQTFNLSTGAPGWSYTGSCTGNVSTPAIAAGSVAFTCTQSDGTPLLYVLGTNGTFYHSFSTPAGATSAPAISGGTAYLLLGGNLTGYSFSGFYQKWSVTPPFSVFTAPAIGDGLVATCGTGGILVVNSSTGSNRFTNPSFPCDAPLTIANGLIYEPQNGSIVIWDEYGDVLARLGIGGAAGPVTVSDGSVYVAESISGIDRFALPPPAVPPPARPDLRQLSPDFTLKPYSPPTLANQ